MGVYGTAVNTIAIVIGGLVGWIAGRFLSRSLRETILAGLGLVVFVAGVEMALNWEGAVLIVIGAVVSGTVIGEVLDIDGRLERGGKWLQQRLGQGAQRNMGTAFIYASLVYCVGPMAILGAMESGIEGSHSILFAKASIDGITAVAFAAALGPGVIVSALPVFLYQGGLTWAAVGLETVVSASSAQITATGGVLIMALGLKILKVKDIRVANMLPALPVAALLTMMAGWW